MECAFSRPHVSDDNPYVESLFRTLKYRPGYAGQRFGSLDEALAWVARFVRWYNYEHLHSAIGFVAPHDRHEGRDVKILAGRRRVYAKAHGHHPERWTGDVRAWKRPANGCFGRHIRGRGWNDRGQSTAPPRRASS